MSSRGGKTHRQADGDWLCPDPKCGNMNFAHRVECNRCSTPKPLLSQMKKGGIEIGKGMAEKSKGLFAADDWQCKTCGNVNWARRTTCNQCNQPKVGKVEERTGYGGGFMERELNVTKKVAPSDDLYDEYGRLRRRSSGTQEKRPALSPVSVKEDQQEEEESDEEESDEDDVDMSKYKLDSDEEDDDDADLAKYKVDSDDEKDADKAPKAPNNGTKKKSSPRSSRSSSRSSGRRSSSSSSSSSSSRSRDRRRSRSRSPKARSRSRSNSRSRKQGKSRKSRSSSSRSSSRDRHRNRRRSRSRSRS